jgi:hypothetical protein
MDLARLVERGEAQANEDMFRAAPRPLAEGLGLEAFPVGDGIGLCAARIDDAQFNRVFGLGLDAPVRPEHLDAVAARFRPLGLTKARLQFAPRVAEQPDLEGWLAERDMTRAPGGWTKRARETAVLPQAPTELAIVDAQDAPGQFAAVACAGFGMPPALAPWLDALVGRPNWRCFVAMDGEAAVSAAALYLAEDCGWLGIGASLPEARGRGGQGALMRRRVEAARDAGKAWAITETGAPLPGEAPGPSYRNMDRHGFAEVYVRPNFVI